MVAIGRDFLLKGVMALGQISNMAGEDCLIFGFARGLASTSEINQAFTEEQTSPDDPTNLKISQHKSLVFWQTLTVVNGDAAGNGRDYINLDRRIGARGKGIPLSEDDGIQPFVYNPTGATVTTGALVDVVCVYKGVWLR